MDTDANRMIRASHWATPQEVSSHHHALTCGLLTWKTESHRNTRPFSTCNNHLNATPRQMQYEVLADTLRTHVCGNSARALRDPTSPTIIMYRSQPHGDLPLFIPGPCFPSRMMGQLILSWTSPHNYNLHGTLPLGPWMDCHIQPPHSSASHGNSSQQPLLPDDIRQKVVIKAPWGTQGHESPKDMKIKPPFIFIWLSTPHA